MQISERVFIVTGGGSGLGAATAQALIDAGARVMIADTDHQAGEASVAALGERAHFVATDVTREADAQAVIDTTVKRFGAIHGLINCAGVAPAEKILGRRGVHRLESFQQAVNINLIGTFNMLRLAAEAMSDNPPDDGGERGVIINTASIAAHEGQIGQTAYAASKAGVVGLTLPAARELAASGIRVMAIAPGIFNTPMMQRMPAEVRERLGEKIPFPSRLGQPDEYAGLVRHIIDNRYLNGEVIRLDGAIRMAAS